MSVTELPSLASAFASASNDMLAAILDQSADCIKVIGAQGTVDYMNRNGQCAMEIDDFCAVAGQQWSALWPQESQVLIEQAIVRAATGETARFEAFCPTAKGSPRWWDVSLSPLRGPSGSIDGYIATSRDISERVSLGTLRDAVTEEMRHRLRNAYTVVGAMLSSHARGRPEQEGFVAGMIQRFNGLSIAQTMKAERDTPCLLCDLAAALLDPFATPDCPIKIGALPDVAPGQSQVDMLALVLGELGVNSTKHGALSAAGSVTLRGSFVGGTIELVWTEQSDRAVESRQREGGQGFRLMQRVLGARGGSLAVEWADHGLTATVRISAA